MCGRVTQKSDKRLALGLVTVDLVEGPFVPRYNGSPGQRLLVVRQNPDTGERTLDPLLWGLIPHWVNDPNGGRRPINAKAETVAALPHFRDAYRRRRCLLPVDNFFEWQGVKGNKQPFAVGLKSGEPFALAAIWENWQKPGTDEWLRTFAVITTGANELVRGIHDRMPVIIPPIAYERWLSPHEPDPRDLPVPFPSEPMTLWPISKRVNKVENDDAAILEPIGTGASSAA